MQKFTISASLMSLAILLIGSTPGTAAPNAIPKLNITPTCESPGRKAMALGHSSIESCKKSENEAHAALSKNWSHYPKTDKANCVGQISQGGLPSYIELHTCLEAFRHARAIREAGAKHHLKTTTPAKRSKE
jgi:hypothetical protein